MVLCWRDSSRWDIVLVLDSFGNGLHQLYFFDYENEDEDEDEKQSIGISGVCHLSLFSQIAPQGPLFTSLFSEKV